MGRLPITAPGGATAVRMPGGATLPHVPLAAASVVVDEEAWPVLRAWAAAVGLKLEGVPSSPGQLQRFLLVGRPLPRPRVQGTVSLTERELQVVGYIAQGLTNGEIGRRLFLSEDTVKTHCRRLFRKLGARDRAHAVDLAHRRGLLAAPAVETTTAGGDGGA